MRRVAVLLFLSLLLVPLAGDGLEVSLLRDPAGRPAKLVPEVRLRGANVLVFGASTWAQGRPHYVRRLLELTSAE